MADFGLYDVVSKEYVDKQIADLVGGASGSLDTLKEIETYLTASGAEGGLVAQINALQVSLSAESSTRASADTALQTSVSSLTSSLSAESSARQASDVSHAASLATNASAISSEASTRASADDALSDRLNDLELDPTTQGDVDTVANNLQSEIERATDKEGRVESKIDDQVIKQSRDLIATNNSITAEETARLNADNTVRGEFASADSALEAKPYSGSGFGVGHNGVLEGDRKYLYFSDKWRLHGSADGSRLVFEYFHDAVPANAESGEPFQPATWKTAVPFISS